MTNDNAAWLSASLGVAFLLMKLIGRHHAHKLASANYDSWPVMAWFGVDLGLLAVSASIAKEIDNVCGLTYAEAAILYLSLAFLVVSGWVCYGRFVKRYSSVLGMDKERVWADFPCCGWICLSLFCGFMGLGIVVRGLSY